jgi:hypothetical protein
MSRMIENTIMPSQLHRTKLRRLPRKTRDTEHNFLPVNNNIDNIALALFIKVRGCLKGTGYFLLKE